MKTKNIVGGLCLLATVAGLAFSGCKTQTTVTTLPDGTTKTNTTQVLDTNRVDAIALQVATDGTTDILKLRPDWRGGFQQAQADLNTLATSSSISINDIQAILQRLPVNELKSTTAQMSFQGAQFVITLAGIPQPSPSTTADIQAVARALADGVAKGLANTDPVSITPPASTN